MPEQSETDKAAKAKQINEAIRAAGASQKEYEGQQLNKLLTALDGIHGGIEELHKRHDDFAKRLSALEKRDDGSSHLPTAGGAHRGATVVDGDDHPPRGPFSHDPDDDRDEIEKAKGAPRRVVADSGDHVQRMIADSEARKREHNAIAEARWKADQVCTSWGLSAPYAMQGERLLDFRRRLLRPWMRYSSEFSKVDPDTLSEPLLSPVEARVFADATKAASDPNVADVGVLRMITRRDDTGRQYYEWAGQPRDWMAQFMGNRRRLVGIRNTTANP
jgi:hypothetical protein